MTVKCIEFKNASGTHTGTVLANKGIAWRVRDSAGEEYLVPKKQVLRTWEEPTEDEAEQELAAAPVTSLVGQLAAAAHSEPTPTKKARVKKEKAPTAERDPNLMTMKELCFELKIEPRIARRNLRRALGNIGTGSRWEWLKDSETLAVVRAALVK